MVPEGTTLAPRNPGVEPWDELDDAKKALYLRMQETFAGFLDHTDDQIGRLIDFLEETDLLEDTMVVLLSDNGASQEGGKHGTLNELGLLQHDPHACGGHARKTRRGGRQDRLQQLSLGLGADRQHAAAVLQAEHLRRRHSRSADHSLAERDQRRRWLARSVPPRQRPDADDLGVRRRFDAPETYKGVPQMPVEGISLTYTFDDAAADTRKRTQYYEMLGHRALWHEGWKAVTMHKSGVPFDDDAWALYNTDDDFSECVNLAADHPEKLRQLVDRWWVEAGKYNVLPLDDRGGGELMIIRRPGHEPPGNRQRFFEGHAAPRAHEDP